MELPDLTQSPRRRRTFGKLIVQFAGALTFSISALLPLAYAADTTPPTTPVVSDDGAYTTSATQLHATWTSADPESGIADYQYQIRQDSTSGLIIADWTSTRTPPSKSASNSVTRTGLNLLQGKSYFFAIKAQNGSKLWSAVGYSNGIKMDTTAPSAVTVTDDGALTPSATQLHAKWTAGSDAESGIAEYQYQIRKGSATGTIIIDWTSAGLNAEVTRTGLTLLHGVKYFIGIRAKNGAGLFSTPNYSDGIWINEPPAITGVTPADGSSFYPPGTIPCTVTATDPSGDALQYRFLIDGQVVQDWNSSSSYSLNPSSLSSGLRTLRMEVKDPWDGTDARTIQLYLFRKPLEAKE